MIRSIASGILLVVLFFNSIGYRLLAGFLESRATETLQRQLDEDQYADTDLLTLKIAAPYLGYAHSSSQFEPAKGQVEVAGVQYSYVKRRYFNDSIELKYIPNSAATRWHNSKNAFFQLVNDIHHPGQQKEQKANARGGQSSGEDFWSMPEGLRLYATNIASRLTHFADLTASLSAGIADTPGHPPQTGA